MLQSASFIFIHIKEKIPANMQSLAVLISIWSCFLFQDWLMAVRIFILSSTFFHLDFIILQLFLSNGSCKKLYMQLFPGHFVESIKASLQKCSLLQSLPSLHTPFKYVKHIQMLLFCNFDFPWAEALNTLCDIFEFISVSLSTSNL